MGFQQFSTCRLSSKSRKFRIIVENLPLGDTPLTRFFLQNFAWGRESQVRTLAPNLTLLALKMWALQPPKLVFFGKNLPQTGYISLTDFYQIWRGEGSPSFAPSREILPLWL